MNEFIELFGDEIADLKNKTKVLLFSPLLNHLFNLCLFLEWGGNKKVYDKRRHGWIKEISSLAQKRLLATENISILSLNILILDYKPFGSVYERAWSKQWPHPDNFGNPYWLKKLILLEFDGNLGWQNAEWVRYQFSARRSHL